MIMVVLLLVVIWSSVEEYKNGISFQGGDIKSHNKKPALVSPFLGLCWHNVIKSEEDHRVDNRELSRLSFLEIYPF